MSECIPPYPDWKAPAEDGQLLIWPQPQVLLARTRENHQRLAGLRDVTLQGVPLADLRSAQRRWIGHPDEQLLIATGHQTELYHPGVWVKNVLINEAAGRLGGAAMHVSVDTDAPKHLHLRWPGGGMPITDDPDLGRAKWSGLLDAPSPQHLTRVERALAEAAARWTFTSMAGAVLAAMKRLTLESPSLAWVLTNSIHQLDWDLGLRHHTLLASPMWLSPAYLVFVHHLLACAPEFASLYNTALSEYRRVHGIKTPGRPWPDLRSTSDECESPFWLDVLGTGQRLRAAVTRAAGGVGGWTLRLPNGQQFGLDPAAEGWSAGDGLGRFLRSADVRLSPRAMTLTMFLRLLVADQFVHGIGGGRYDQITDCVIRRLLHIEPPHFSVTTATLYFPEAVGRPRVDLYGVLQEGRRLRHGGLWPEKMEWVRRIDTLPRNSPQRRELFHEMHARLADFQRTPSYREWEERRQQAQRLREEQAALFDRELFFAIQPAERLQLLISRYNDQFRG